MLEGLATVEVQSDTYRGRSARTIQALVVWGERTLAVAVVVAVLAFAVSVSREALDENWADVDAFTRSIGSALLVGIGLELSRLLVTHELVAVLELMAFALARKILTPGMDATDMLVVVLAFIALVGTRRYIMTSTSRPSAVEADPASV